MTSKVVSAYCTFPNRKTAEKICRQLVADGTIACANIFAPHTAIYKWEGKIQKDQEVAVIMKLKSRNKPELKKAILKNHPYTVPALVFWKVDDGLTEFLRWI
jgi:periplasmic divalent cation tolerance protein